MEMLIGEFYRKEAHYQIYNIKGNYSIFRNQDLIQNNITPDEFVRWASNALEDSKLKIE